MESWLVPILVAIIGGPIMFLLSLLRKENKSQHAEGREMVREVITKVDRIGTKLDGHIGWHKGKEEK